MSSNKLLLSLLLLAACSKSESKTGTATQAAAVKPQAACPAGAYEHQAPRFCLTVPPGYVRADVALEPEDAEEGILEILEFKNDKKSVYVEILKDAQYDQVVSGWRKEPFKSERQEIAILDQAKLDGGRVSFYLQRTTTTFAPNECGSGPCNPSVRFAPESVARHQGKVIHCSAGRVVYDAAYQGDPELLEVCKTLKLID